MYWVIVNDGGPTQAHSKLLILLLQPHRGLERSTFTHTMEIGSAVAQEDSWVNSRIWMLIAGTIMAGLTLVIYV